MNEDCFQFLIKNRPTIALKIFKYMLYHHPVERPSYDALEDLGIQLLGISGQINKTGNDE